jgi:hypothetical protein
LDIIKRSPDFIGFELFQFVAKGWTNLFIYFVQKDKEYAYNNLLVQFIYLIIVKFGLKSLPTQTVNLLLYLIKEYKQSVEAISILHELKK